MDGNNSLFTTLLAQCRYLGKDLLKSVFVTVWCVYLIFYMYLLLIYIGYMWGLSDKLPALQTPHAQGQGCGEEALVPLEGYPTHVYSTWSGMVQDKGCILSKPPFLTSKGSC